MTCVRCATADNHTAINCWITGSGEGALEVLVFSQIFRVVSVEYLKKYFIYLLGKRPLGKRRLRWEDGIRMDLREIGWGVWIGFNWLRIGTSGELL
jgi:hypothetical protein